MFVVLIALFVILFAMLAGPYLVRSTLDRVYNATRTSELQYSLTITSSLDLSEITLFIPLPTDETGTSPVIQMLGAENQGIAFDGFNISVFGANNESYLRLSAEYLGASQDLPERSYTFSVANNSSALNTREPIRYDYTLFPKRNLTDLPCAPSLGDDRTQCFRYQSLIYASYKTAADTRVQIRVDLSGSNQWRILEDFQNGYIDSMDLALYGPVSGWHSAEGLLVTSLGDDNPYWTERKEESVPIRLSGGVDTSMMRWHTFTPLP